jgi:glyoxylase-like metal-dependent hydrolase (beta-lactamase superfamily II)
MKEILKNIHLLKLGSVNAYLVDHGTLTLIDTGNPGSEDKIIAYIRKIGKEPKDVENIIVTHLHTDHAGSAAALATMTGANVSMHPVDAALVKTGKSFRDQVTVTPGIFNRFLFNAVIKRAPRVIPPFEVTSYLEDNTSLDIGKGFRVFHVPGHAQGQIALLYEKTLFAADTAGNLMGLALAPFYENLEQGKQSQNWPLLVLSQQFLDMVSQS